MTMRRTIAITALTLAAAALGAAPASADPPAGPHGSCAGFGANVSTLARTLGGDFGAIASGVASSGPGAFPRFVVHPEQATHCEPR